MNPVLERARQLCEKYNFHLYSELTREWEYQLMWDWVTMYIPEGSRILDVGTGMSPWPAMLMEAGYIVTAQDVYPTGEDCREDSHRGTTKEINRAIDALYNFKKDTGLDGRYTTTDIMDLNEEYYAVTALSSFEHFSQHWTKIEKYAQKITQLGRIILLTTDLAERHSQNLGTGWRFHLDDLSKLFTLPWAKPVQSQVRPFFVPPLMEALSIIALDVRSNYYEGGYSSDL